MCIIIVTVPMMNERERFLSVMKGLKPDRTPWFADLSYVYSAMESDGTLDGLYSGDAGYLRFHKDLGAGICFYAPFPWKSRYNGNITVRTTVNGLERRITYETPEGSIFSDEKYLPETYSWSITRHYINDISDLRIMAYIHANTVFEENYRDFSKIRDLWGGAGIAAALPPIAASPFQKLVARWAGIEKTVEILSDNPDESRELLKTIGDSEDPVYGILCESPAEYVEFAENLSSEVTGKTFFSEFNAPYYKKRNDMLHSSGKLTGIHIDGTLKPCLSMLSDCGFDAAEAVTPYPAGDIRVEDLRAEAGDGIVIWGGLPGVLFSPLYPEDVFIDHVHELMSVFPPGSGFILGVADQVPPDGLLSRVRMVRDIVG